MNKERADELAKAVKVFLENTSTEGSHSGTTTRRELAEKADIILYPGQAWGTFQPAQLQAVFDALEAYEKS